MFDEIKIKTKLEIGRLNIIKFLSIDNNNLRCENEINLLSEFPILYFNCKIDSPDKKKLLKKFKVDYKIKNQPMNLFFNGNLNILKKKINFENVRLNNNYNATQEDLKYFKKTFENIMFENNSLNVFDLIKIKKFILEIS